MAKRVTARVGTLRNQTDPSECKQSGGVPSPHFEPGPLYWLGMGRDHGENLKRAGPGTDRRLLRVRLGVGNAVVFSRARDVRQQSLPYMPFAVFALLVVKAPVLMDAAGLTL